MAAYMRPRRRQRVEVVVVRAGDLIAGDVVKDVDGVGDVGWFEVTRHVRDAGRDGNVLVTLHDQRQLSVPQFRPVQMQWLVPLDTYGCVEVELPGCGHDPDDCGCCNECGANLDLEEHRPDCREK